MSKLGLAAKMGGKEKRAALASMSKSGELADAAAGEDFGSALAGLGGGLPGGGGGLSGLFGGPRPMGSSSTRQSGSKRKDKKKRKKRR
jgi:hypothetical protein